MTGFDVYQKYVAIKLHFNSTNFNYIKSQGTKGSSLENYKKRKDMFYFKRLSKELRSKDIVPFFVAQFLQNNNSWIGEMTDDFNECLSIYRKFIAARKSLTYNINEDLRLIQEFLDERKLKVNDLFAIKHGITHPLILRFYLEEMISIETMIYLDNKYHFIEFFKEELYDPISEHHLLIMEKYKIFMKINVHIDHILVDN